jgi:predicted membrane-bound spermidine synthase
MPSARASSARSSRAPRPTDHAVTALLTLVFVISGAAGLIYESIWSRYLSLLVGHSAYAQIIVLVIFLGGMSLGALLVGQRSERLRQPLLWYAGVEALVGVIGLLFNFAYVDISNLAYETIFPALAGGWLLLVVKWLLAALLILPQSILLGTTFPLMSAGAIRLLRARTGGMLGLLYFANSLGAAIGVLLAGFVLLARVGLPGTLVTAAIFNFVAAFSVTIAVRLTWRVSTVPDIPVAPTPHAPHEAPARAALPSGFSWWFRSELRWRRSFTRSPGSGCCRWYSEAPRTRSS